AEDGIRDDLVTGVQTCALPISGPVGSAAADSRPGRHHYKGGKIPGFGPEAVGRPRADAGPPRLRESCVEENLRRSMVELVRFDRSEERRVGKESRSRGPTVECE